MTSLDRRTLLARSGAVALVAGPFSGLAARAASAAPTTADDATTVDYGPLKPVPDLRDGVVRLHLPRGFKYRSFDHAGELMSDGKTPIPSRHDGMAAFPWDDGDVLLIRNHERNGATGAFGPTGRAYDEAAPGGTTTVVVGRHGQVRRNWVSLNGTQQNCSGGPMPWGSWVSCEETVNGPDVGNDFTGSDNTLLERRHGYIYEVPVGGRSSGRPIRMAGRFSHESIEYSPVDGKLYMTEDNFGFPSGFYRYTPPQDPAKVGRILDGGTLQMLAVKGEANADLSVGQPMGATYDCQWVDVPDPDPDFDEWPEKPTNDQAIQYVGNQGRTAGAAIFSRLEGMARHYGKLYFVSTQGGEPVDPEDERPSGFGDGRGQVWEYDPATSRLRLVYESTSRDVLDMPDNVTASVSGTLVLCEDSSEGNYLRGLTQDGRVFDFAKNAIEGQEDDEFAGSTFAGRTLFCNIQSEKSLSFAIWGPFWRGGFGSQPGEFGAPRT